MTAKNRSSKRDQSSRHFGEKVFSAASEEDAQEKAKVFWKGIIEKEASFGIYSDRLYSHPTLSKVIPVVFSKK
jgi:hypothetical protein